MRVCILDCYTDEASGLGVMPYLGTYPRYCWSRLRQLHPDAQLRYLTIDDLRLHAKHDGKIPERAKERKTDITIYNLTKNAPDAMRILHDAELVVVVLGVHVPGKYLSAVPGVLTEVLPLVRALPGRKVLIGPAVFGSQLFGGRRSETADLSCFSEVDWDYLDINEYAQVGSAAVGADLVSQLGFEVIAELETGKGCDVGKCSFCLEPLKNKVSFRTVDDVLAEAKALYAQGVRHFRLGKQTCFYSYQGGDVNAIVSLLRGMREACPQLKTLHIDNVNPNRVVADRGAVVTKAIVQYCTPGNVAAFGVESFDLAVVKENRLNTVPAIAYKATKILNEHGAAKGVNGMPHFLPGINIIYGLKAESKETHAQNMLWLKRFLD
ncbi:radical SAM protein, partial [Candidatus Woesearchaeota archaeon CG11_big_fil_rev_8_21_14_0_20_57_5]